MVAFCIFDRTMRVIAVKTLKLYAKRKKEAEQSLFTWYQEAVKAGWKNHNELKEQIRNASIAGDKRVVFNIHGNKYRLIVDIEYRVQIIFYNFPNNVRIGTEILLNKTISHSLH